MVLKLLKMGMDFPKDNYISDCGNYRVRATFTDKYGFVVTADFTGGKPWNSMYADASYYLPNGICKRYSPLEEYKDGTRHIRYCLEEILKAVNCFSVDKYDSVEVVNE